MPRLLSPAPAYLRSKAAIACVPSDGKRSLTGAENACSEKQKVLTIFQQETGVSRRQLLFETVNRGKYAPLFRHLSQLPCDRWSATFAEVEALLGSKLPNSARVFRAWWANGAGLSHSQSMAWVLAGWKTRHVDMDVETLTFRKVVAVEVNASLRDQQPVVRSSAPTMGDFRAVLNDLLTEARNSGEDFLVIGAGALHRIVGGYPTPFNRMPMCCNAMNEAFGLGDRVIEKPAMGVGASLTIKYSLPR